MQSQRWVETFPHVIYVFFFIEPGLSLVYNNIWPLASSGDIIYISVVKTYIHNTVNKLYIFIVQGLNCIGFQYLFWSY